MSFSNQKTADLVYYDVVVSNIGSTTEDLPFLYFNETRNNPFILDPESYYLSIIRFTLDTPTLPVIVPEIQPAPNADPNATIYSINLDWTHLPSGTNYNAKRFIQFVPQNKTVEVPPPPRDNDSGLQINNSGYYDVYNYQYWIYLINNTFQNVFDDLVNLVSADGRTLPTTHAPILSWDTQQNLAILSADDDGYDDTKVNYIKIYFNNSLYGLFSSFPAVIENKTNGRQTRLITNTFGSANIVPYPPVAPTYQAIQVVQEYSTISMWSPITAVVFTSNTLPIISNQVSKPSLFFNGKTFVSGGNNANISQVITDFVADEGIYKPNIVYAPRAQYRLIEMVGNSPLYNLDVEVFYKNRFGELIPFRLGAGATATIKFLFTRK